MYNVFLSSDSPKCLHTHYYLHSKVQDIEESGMGLACMCGCLHICIEVYSIIFTVYATLYYAKYIHNILSSCVSNNILFV